MEKLIRGALERCGALKGLAQFAGERAIFFRMAPEDTCFSGAQFPRCVFDWRPENGGLRAGVIEIEIIAINETGTAPETLADELRVELDGMVFGGDEARILRWRETLPFTSRSEAYSLNGLHEPQCIGANVIFDVYQYARPIDAAAGNISRAIFSTLGGEFCPVNDMPKNGVGCEKTAAYARINYQADGKASGGYAWREFETAVHIFDRGKAGAAYERLAGCGLLELDGDGALVDSVRYNSGADTFSQGQVILRGRLNALRIEKKTALNHVEVSQIRTPFKTEICTRE